MSSSLLSARLRGLERAGLITRRRLHGQRGHEYQLTPAGEALGPLLISLGVWSREWLRREITEEDADPALLMWDVQRNVLLDRLPQDRLVTFFRFRGVADKKRAWWLVTARGGTDLCLSDPGYGVDVRVDAEPRAMAEVWIGKLALGAAVRARRITISGPEHLVRSVPHWLGLNAFAYRDPATVLAERAGAKAAASAADDGSAPSRVVAPQLS
jgi:hypothetical protein